MIKQLYKESIDFVSQVKDNQFVIRELVKRDLKGRYVKNYFGLSWTILEPLFLILTLWFVFSYIFPSNRLPDIPYITYLISGYIPFLFFSNSINQSTNSITAYSFVLKKTDFRLAIIPIIKIITETILHSFVVFLAVAIILLKGIPISIFIIQVLYYQFSLFILLIALGWITSTVSVLFPDFKLIINIIIRLLFYLTPVFWNLSMFPKKYHFIFKLNPLFYIVEGYRDSLIFGIGFWERSDSAIYFWTFTAIVFLLSVLIFKRLRNHVLDVI